MASGRGRCTQGPSAALARPAGAVALGAAAATWGTASMSMAAARPLVLADHSGSARTFPWPLALHAAGDTGAAIGAHGSCTEAPHAAVETGSVGRSALATGLTGVTAFAAAGLAARRLRAKRQFRHSHRRGVVAARAANDNGPLASVQRFVGDTLRMPVDAANAAVEPVRTAQRQAEEFRTSLGNLKAAPQEITSKLTRPFTKAATVVAASPAQVAGGAASVVAGVSGASKIVEEALDGAKVAATNVAAIPGGLKSRLVDTPLGIARGTAEAAAVLPAKVRATVTKVQDTAEAVASFPNNVATTVQKWTDAVEATTAGVQRLGTAVVEMPGTVKQRVDSTVDGVQRTASRIASLPSLVTQKVGGAVGAVQGAVGVVQNAAGDVRSAAAAAQNTTDSVVRSTGAVATFPGKTMASIGETVDSMKKTVDAVTSFPAKVKGGVDAALGVAGSATQVVQSGVDGAIFVAEAVKKTVSPATSDAKSTPQPGTEEAAPQHSAATPPADALGSAAAAPPAATAPMRK